MAVAPSVDLPLFVRATGSDAGARGAAAAACGAVRGAVRTGGTRWRWAVLTSFAQTLLPSGCPCPGLWHGEHYGDWLLRLAIEDQLFGRYLARLEREAKRLELELA